MRLENKVALFTAPPPARAPACITRIADEHCNHSEQPEEGKRVR